MRSVFLFFTLLVVAVTAHADAPPKLGIVAVVNDEIVSSLDVEERIRFLLATTGLSDTAETRQRLRPQVIRALIDERLQLQEAATNGITVSQAEIERAIATIEQQHQRASGSFRAHLQNKGVSEASFEQQVRAQIGWTRLVIAKVRPRIKISDGEIARAQEKQSSGERVKEVKIATISLPVDSPSNEESVRLLAEKLTNELRGGASFDAVANQFSAQDVGSGGIWVKQTDLAPTAAEAVASLSKEEIANPVKTLAGYQIIKLLDSRVSDAVPVEVDAEVALKDIQLTLKPNASKLDASLLLTIAKGVAQNPGRCADKGIANISGLEEADIHVSSTRTLLSMMPDTLRSMVVALGVGAITEPFATPDGLRLLMLCERIDIPVSKALMDKTRAMLFDEKLALEATKYMRNLRRNAFIDVRAK